MPKKATIKPRACKKLWEHMTPAADAPTGQPFTLPASFPAHALDDDQLHELEQWWDEWIADTLHAVKQALLMARSRSTKNAAPPVNLQNLIVHSVVLAHLLRLHPSAERSLPELAKELGVSCARVYYARDAILAALGASAVAAFRGAREVHDITLEQISRCRELDATAATTPSARVLLIPFAGYHGVAARFAVVQHLATLPGVESVREDITNENRNAVRITLKS